MGGIPAAVGGAASAVGGSLSGAAKSFYGAAKSGIEDNVVQPWKNALSDMRGNQGGPPSDPTQPQPQNSSAMQQFFNAPATETPAMRNRRMLAQQG